MARERGEPAARNDPGAEFAASRVGVARRRPPLLVLGLLLAAGGLVAVGVSGRGSEPGATAPPRSAAATLAPIERDVAESTPPQRVAGPEMTSAPGLLQLTAQRQLDSVFVHGEVFVENVTWVYLSLQDASGRIAGWGSVSAPGGVRPRAGDGPTLRFDLQLASPDANFPGPLTLNATAYGDGGTEVAAASIDGLALRSVVAMDAGPEATTAPAAGIRYGWPPTVGVGDAFVPVRLETPASAASTVTTESIRVAGVLRIKAASVRVSLQTLGHELLAEQTIDTTDPNGGVRPLRTPGFDVQLAVPTPRPVGERLLLFVTAYDSLGKPLGFVRRTITVATLGG